MANRWAVATGNWSDTATWDGGTLPTAADDVFADGKTVTIDQNVTVLSLRTTQRAGGTAGGGFTVSGTYTIDCSAGLGIIPGTTTCLTITNTSGTVTYYGLVDMSPTTQNLNSVTISGSATTNWIGNIISTISGTTNSLVGVGLINVTGAATLNVTGNITPPAIRGRVGISLNNASATLNVTGNLVGGGGSPTPNPAVYCNADAIVNITGNVTGGTSTESYGIRIAGNKVSITGSVYGSATVALIYGVFGTGTVTVTGPLYAQAAAAIGSTGATVTGPFISGTSGYLPIVSTGVVTLTPISNNEFRFKTASGTSSLFSSDVTSGAPTANNVRSGTVYGGGTLTGTLAVPSPSYVALGVATDNTVGSLAYNSDSAIADYLWNKQTSALTTAGSIGERLKNASTVDTTGAQIASFGGA